MKRFALVFVAVAVSACGNTPAPPPAETPVPAAAPAQKVSIGQLPDVDIASLLAHTKVLSSDEFQGRAPGTIGEEKSVAYLADQFKKAGAKPGNTDGTYVQKVPLVGITPSPAPLFVKHGAQQQSLKWKDDIVAWTKHVAPSAAIVDSELIFVGYGVAAPEFNWDDYKGVDVKGKTLLVLVNDPPVPIRTTQPSSIRRPSAGRR